MSNPRHLAVRTASERTPCSFERPSNGNGEPLSTRDYFGVNTFGIEQMREHLPGEVVKRFADMTDHREPLEPDIAVRIAQGALEWALQRGVTHFCHWFQPMTGATAEKHDAFLAFDEARPIAQFSGEQLIWSEPDASSFPSGGIRTTFEARGYTAWDPTSPMFIAERPGGAVLCIPSAFFSYNGEALDQKTPLLRSMDAIHRSATRLLALLGDEARTVTPTAGPEQEYFLIDKAYAACRPDLTICGRSLIGAAAPKGQTLEDHYFGSIPTRVFAFMQELDSELYKLGVPAKTRHNEVAPSQFELAVLYRTGNIAADHNQLVMELIRKVAARHDFFALLHEKPFAGVNGSGKHLNWSLADDRGRNLLKPGAEPWRNTTFLAFLAATLEGVDAHADLLRASIATHGNDFRLGANEAPPAIISVFLGEQLTAITTALRKGEKFAPDGSPDHIELGIERMPRVARHTTDRNRTSPFAFTGDKFEFRAVGSNTSISFPLTSLNTAVAAGIDALCDRIEAHGGGEKAVRTAIRESLRATERICFEGNNYSEEWLVEAERRGLPNMRATPQALEALRNDATIALFERYHVLTSAELASRHMVKVERYLRSVEIEVEVMRELVDQHVLPAALAERGEMAAGLAALSQLGALDPVDTEHLARLSALIADLREASRSLEAKLAGSAALDEIEKAAAYAREVIPSLQTVRAAADRIEVAVADHRWTLPRYREMLFQS